MSLIFSLMVMAIMAWVANKKGFSPWRWILAGGIPGFIVLLFLPSASNVELDVPTRENRMKKGNRIGTIISIICLVLVIIWLAIIFLFAPTTIKSRVF